ncbi:MAG: PTS sugar transporter subunit IIA [Candidatus Hodarchaeales archaeon]
MNYFDTELISRGLKVSNANQAIKKLGKLLVQGEYVKDSFIENAIKREKEFATGLPLNGEINVAIPHTDIEYVNKPAIAVGILDTPVEFNVMGSPDKLIQVSVVFLLAIKESDRQLKMLKMLAEFFERPELLLKITAALTDEEIVELLSEQLQLSGT